MRILVPKTVSVPRKLIAVFDRVVTLTDLKSGSDKIPDHRNPTSHEITTWKQATEEKLARFGIKAPRYEVVTVFGKTSLRVHINCQEQPENEIAFVTQALREKVTQETRGIQFNFLPFSRLDRK